MLLLSFSCFYHNLSPFLSSVPLCCCPLDNPWSQLQQVGAVWCVFVSSLSPPARTWLHVYCEEDSFAIPTARSSIFIEFSSYIARSRAFRDSWEKVVPGTYDYTWYLLIVRVNEYYARVGYPRALFGWIYSAAAMYALLRVATGPSSSNKNKCALSEKNPDFPVVFLPP